MSIGTNMKRIQVICLTAFLIISDISVRVHLYTITIAPALLGRNVTGDPPPSLVKPSDLIVPLFA